MMFHAQANSPTVWFKVGQCHQAMNALDDARDCFENGVSGPGLFSSVCH